MKNKYGNVTDLAERIEHAFVEIDSDICVVLRETDSAYAKMHGQLIGLQQKYPIITKITEIGIAGDGALKLSEEEYKALLQFLRIKNRMEEVERKQLYIQGHKDNYAYLVKIAGLHID